MKKKGVKNQEQQKYIKGNSIAMNWSSNRFNDDKYYHFQDELFKKNYDLKQLSLNLRESNIDSLSLEKIEDIVKIIKISETLQLNMISCKIENFESIQNLLSSQKDLSILKLEFGAVVMLENQVQFISNGFCSYNKLKRLNLNLSGCSLGHVGTQILMEGISQLISLEHLDLDISSNKLESVAGNHLSQGISKCYNLVNLKLNLTNNCLYTSDLLQNSIEGLGSLNHLYEFELTISSMFDRTLSIEDRINSQPKIQQFCQKLIRLQNIYIFKFEPPYDLFSEYNNCTNFNKAILKLRQLKILKVEFFGYYFDRLKIFVEGIESLENINYLYINTCNIINQKLKDISCLKKCKRLVYYNTH